MDATLKQALETQRGSYMIIPIDGLVSVMNEKPNFKKVYEVIGCEMCDALVLRMGGSTGAKDPIVMLLDDTGMIDNKPVNTRATELIRSVKKYKYDIHGTVVIVNDADFGEPLPARFNR